MSGTLTGTAANPAATAPVRLCALLTCFNRRDKTVASLEALQASASQVPGLSLHAVLVDDGSTDGTADAIKAHFSWVTVVRSDGTLFWCRGMHRAFAEALAQGHDNYLWLNDDTMLQPDSVQRLLACARSLQAQAPAPVVVVGSTCDPASGKLTYGGSRRESPHRRITFHLVQPASQPQRVDTFHGNIVLVTAGAAALAGNLDATFEHAMGDIDYALRAGRAGVDIWIAPGFFGTCSHNPLHGSFVDSNENFRTRLRHMLSRKGLPLRSWLHFTRRHAGWAWPVFFVWPYMRLVIECLKPRK